MEIWSIEVNGNIEEDFLEEAEALAALPKYPGGEIIMFDYDWDDEYNGGYAGAWFFNEVGRITVEYCDGDGGGSQCYEITTDTWY